MKVLERPWVIALVAAVAGAAVGSGAVWMSQRDRIATLNAQVAGLEASSRTTANADVLLEALDNRDKTIEELTEKYNKLASTQPVPKKKTETVTSREFAYLRSIALGSSPSLVADYAQYLTGNDAAKAASSNGDESPPPNDYYIVNTNARLRTLRIAEDVTVRLSTEPREGSTAEGYASDLETLASYLSDEGDDTASLRGNGYWLTLENGLVVEIKEQFTP